MPSHYKTVSECVKKRGTTRKKCRQLMSEDK